MHTCIAYPVSSKDFSRYINLVKFYYNLISVDDLFVINRDKHYI